LAAVGPVANDTGDADEGPNHLQNFPIIGAAWSNLFGTRVQGILNSQPTRAYRLEFFANTNGGTGGYGEGQTYIGATSVTTDVFGNAAFTFLSLMPAAPPVGQFVTATATDPDGNTSEFSRARVVDLHQCVPPPAGLVSWWRGRTIVWMRRASTTAPFAAVRPTRLGGWGQRFVSMVRAPFSELRIIPASIRARNCSPLRLGCKRPTMSHAG
jgi:hypothetical protein